MYKIDYTYFKEDGEVFYDVYDKDKVVYSETVLSDFESVNDIEQTGIEIAKSKGFYPCKIK